MPPVCPSGYLYAGDDTSSTSQPYSRGVYYAEEESRSPVYSCYRLFYEDGGYSSPDTWLSATHRCWQDLAQLVSFEDAQEMNRVMSAFKSRIYVEEPDDGDNSIGANYGREVRRQC